MREKGSSSDGPVETITEEEVRTAIKQMKKGKAAGPSGVTVEMLQAAGEAGIRWVTEICNAILKEGKVPSDWERSWIVSVYKGKGDALECGSYRGIKLLDQVMKVMERVIEKRVRSIVLIDEMQFGFRPGRGTTDAIFIVRQLQEKYLGRKRELWMAFLDLEKAFDRVPREVVWWALGQMNVDRSLINVIMSMYKNARASVKVNGVGGRDFPVEVGVHQGSVLSPLLFIIVMEALSRTFSDRGLPWELLYADDLVLLADTEDELKEKLQRWKSGLERKGLRVNVGKTKVMKCGVGLKKTVDSGKYPCGVCGKGVKSNSIQCTLCIKWVHKIGSRAFSAAAPETWNALPTDIKLIDSLDKFKIDLKLIYSVKHLSDHVTFLHAHDLAARPGRSANLWRVTNDCTYLLTSAVVASARN